ncbi:MAG: hypothetical protein H6867_09965 [Rhodospirillales bacterium]|nr:hypothetical protein [Rhodospirillales bacterium]MCB9995891.1 hypothetical protein [Rhodospirillales bacterium]
MKIDIKKIAQRQFPMVTKDKLEAMHTYADTIKQYLDMVVEAGLIRGYQSTVQDKPLSPGYYGSIVLTGFNEDVPEEGEFRFYLDSAELHIRFDGGKSAKLFNHHAFGEKRINLKNDSVEAITKLRPDVMAVEAGQFLKSIMSIEGRTKYADYLHNDVRQPKR